MTPIYNSTTVPHRTTIDTVQYSHAHTTIHDSNLQQYLYNSIVPYIHRSAPISHTFLPALRSTFAARDLYCTPGTSMNCTDVSTLYFLCSPIYIIRTSTATCCDYIFLCGDTYIMNVTERQIGFWRSPRVTRTRTISNAFVFCFFVFCFFFTDVCKQGLK